MPISSALSLRLNLGRPRGPAHLVSASVAVRWSTGGDVQHLGWQKGALSSACDQGAEQLAVLDEVPVAEELTDHPFVGGGPDPRPTLRVPEEVRGEGGEPVEVRGVIEQQAAEVVLDLVGDAADG